MIKTALLIVLIFGVTIAWFWRAARSGGTVSLPSPLGPHTIEFRHSYDLLTHLRNAKTQGKP